MNAKTHHGIYVEISIHCHEDLWQSTLEQEAAGKSPAEATKKDRYVDRAKLICYRGEIWNRLVLLAGNT